MSFTTFIKEFWAFGIKQILNCAFPAFIFSMLALSHLLPSHWIARYDFMLLMCILAQIILVLIGWETKEELLMICTFHLIGLIMEIYKVHVGSWSYPEDALTKIFKVPIYSGFMYASVTSYMVAAWHRFELKFSNWPAPWICIALAFGIYLNFFTNNFMWDYRYLIALLIIPIFYKSKVYFKNIDTYRSMPVLLSFLLIAFFIFVAENIATFLGAWKYTYQHGSWQMVKWHKLSSWTFMVMISYFILAVWKKAGKV